MRDLLLRWQRGKLSRIEERELVDLHHRHFLTRAARLPPEYFPGREKSEEAIRSLSNGAFAWFGRGAFRRGLSPFAYALTDRFERPEGILYYWRGAAVMTFFEKEGPPILRERRNLMRNVHLALRDRPSAGRRGEEVTYGYGRGNGPIDLERLEVDVRGVRVPEAVERTLRAAERPLTAAEIASVLYRAQRYLDESSRPPDVIDGGTSSGQPLADDLIHEAQLRLQVQRFFDELKAEERSLLVDRGWGADRKLAPFDRLAQAGARSKEWYRSSERQVFRRFFDRFDDEDRRRAFSLLLRLIDGSPTGHRDGSLPAATGRSRRRHTRE